MQKYRIGMSIVYGGRVHKIVGIYPCRLLIKDIGSENEEEFFVNIDDLR